jgi:hypothetical protein
MWTKFNETMLKHRFPKSNFKGFMVNNAQAIGTLSKLFMVLVTLPLGWLIMNAFIYSIGFSRLISTLKN